MILKVGNKTFAFLFIFPSQIYKSQFRNHSLKYMPSSSLCRSWYQWCCSHEIKWAQNPCFFSPDLCCCYIQSWFILGCYPLSIRKGRIFFSDVPHQSKFWDTLFWHNCFLLARKRCGENMEILSLNNFEAENCSKGIWGQIDEFWSTLRWCNCRACSSGYPSNFDLHSWSCSSLHSFPDVSKIKKRQKIKRRQNLCFFPVLHIQAMHSCSCRWPPGLCQRFGCLCLWSAQGNVFHWFGIGAGMGMGDVPSIAPSVKLCLLSSLFPDLTGAVSLSARCREGLAGAECGILLMLLFLFYWCFCIANQTQASYCSPRFFLRVHVYI